MPDETHRIAPLCSSMGHEKVAAVGVVVLGDCEPEGSCEGHPYCAECMTSLSADPYNTIIEDRRPASREVPDIFTVTAHPSPKSVAAELRNLADKIEAEELTLISVYNSGFGGPWEAALQVVVTRWETP